MALVLDMRVEGQVWHFPDQVDIKAGAIDWLRSLGGPVWIKVSGADSHRCRVITTLLHGNEPSGFYAVHQWLSSYPKPVCDIYILIASVEAATYQPLFTRRMISGERDLNRCFRPPFDGKQGALANSVINTLTELQPEAVIDIHNTSGTGPSFAVAIGDDLKRINLAELFCRRVIVTDIRLGSLMELDLGFPVVTIECGGAKDRESVNVALEGVRCFSEKQQLFDTDQTDVEILYHPMRLELDGQASLCFSRVPEEAADITIWDDIETYNFGVTGANQCLGWVGVDGLSRLKLMDVNGVNRLLDYFVERRGLLYTRVPLRLFMATSSVEIANQDCLFYLVSAEDSDRDLI